MLGMFYLILLTPEGGLFLIVILAFNLTKHNRTVAVVFDTHFSAAIVLF